MTIVPENKIFQITKQTTCITNFINVTKYDLVMIEVIDKIKILITCVRLFSYTGNILGWMSQH